MARSGLRGVLIATTIVIMAAACSSGRETAGAAPTTAQPSSTTAVPTASTADTTTSSAAPTTAEASNRATPSAVKCSEGELIDRVLDDDTEGVLAVLQCGVDPNTRSDGMTVLHLAAIRNHAPTVNVLLTAGADPSLPNSNGSTPLMEAARQNAPDAAFILLLTGADPEQAVQDEEGRKAIHFAAANGSIDVLNVFVETGLDIETTDNFGNHALIFAVIANQPEFVDAILATGMDPDLPAGAGLVAMDHAIAWNLPEVIDSIRAARWLQPSSSE